MASCRSLSSRVRDVVLAMIIAALILAYGTFGAMSMGKHHQGAAQEDYMASVAGNKPMQTLRSFVRFIGDGFLGMVLAVSVLSYYLFHKAIGSLTVVVNGVDYSCASPSARLQHAAKKQHQRTMQQEQESKKNHSSKGGRPSKTASRIPQQVLACTKSVCLKASSASLRKGARLLSQQNNISANHRRPSHPPPLTRSSFSSSFSSTLAPIIEEEEPVVVRTTSQKPQATLTEKLHRIHLPASVRLALLERRTPMVNKIHPRLSSRLPSPFVQRY